MYLLVYGSCESDPAVHTNLVGRQEVVSMHHHYHKPKQDQTLMMGIQYHIIIIIEAKWANPKNVFHEKQKIHIFENLDNLVEYNVWSIVLF